MRLEAAIRFEMSERLRDGKTNKTITMSQSFHDKFISATGLTGELNILYGMEVVIDKTMSEDKWEISDAE